MFEVPIFINHVESIFDTHTHTNIQIRKRRASIEFLFLFLKFHFTEAFSAFFVRCSKIILEKINYDRSMIDK